MNEDLDVADVLEKAADALWMHGRATGSPVRRACNGDAAMCVLEAVSHALGETSPSAWTNAICGPAGLAIGRYLIDHPEVLAGVVSDQQVEWASDNFGPHSNDLPWLWNDHLPLTPENDALVIDTLRHCAKSIRNGETAE